MGSGGQRWDGVVRWGGVGWGGVGLGRVGVCVCVCVCVCSQASRSRATLSCDSSYIVLSFSEILRTH